MFRYGYGYPVPLVSLAALLKQNISRNTDIVEASGYFDLVNTNDSSFATTGRAFLGLSNINKVRQSGSLIKFGLYFNKTQATECFFDIWRKNGSTWDRIHHVDIFAKLSTGLNDITFDTALAVVDGDYVAISGKRDATNTIPSISGLTGAQYGTLKYVNNYGSDTGYDWNAQLSLTSYTVSMKTYIVAPLVVGIGDSIMAGHPLHYSSAENSTTYSVLNQVLAQMQILDLKYIYQNMGIGSHTSTQIAARFAADVVALKPKIVIINGGVNDIYGGVISKATFLANYTTMLDLCQTNSIIPVVCKVLPWTEGTNEQMAIRDEWNADLSALVATYEGAICIDFDSEIGQNRVGGAVGNLWDIKTAYNAGDDVHLNLDGYAKMAELIDIEIKKKYILV